MLKKNGDYIRKGEAREHIPKKEFIASFEKLPDQIMIFQSFEEACDFVDQRRHSEKVHNEETSPYSFVPEELDKNNAWQYHAPIFEVRVVEDPNYLEGKLKPILGTSLPSDIRDIESAFVDKKRCLFLTVNLVGGGIVSSLKSVWQNHTLYEDPNKPTADFIKNFNPKTIEWGNFLKIANLQAIPIVPPSKSSSRNLSTLFTTQLIGENVLNTEYAESLAENDGDADSRKLQAGGNHYYAKTMMKQLPLAFSVNSVPLFEIIKGDNLKQELKACSGKNWFKSKYLINLIMAYNGNAALAVYKCQTVSQQKEKAYISRDDHNESFPLPVCYIPLNPHNKKGIEVLKKKNMFHSPQLFQYSYHFQWIADLNYQSNAEVSEWGLPEFFKNDNDAWNFYLNHWAPTQRKLITINKGVVWACFANFSIYNNIKKAYRVKASPDENFSILAQDICDIIFQFAFDPCLSLQHMKTIDDKLYNYDKEKSYDHKKTHWATLFKNIIEKPLTLDTTPPKKNDMLVLSGKT